MFSIQQLIKALRKLRSSGELAKSFQHVSAGALTMPSAAPPEVVHVTSHTRPNEISPQQQQQQEQKQAEPTALQNETKTEIVASQLHVIGNQRQHTNCQTSHNHVVVAPAITTTQTPPPPSPPHENKRVAAEKLSLPSARCGVSLASKSNVNSTVPAAQRNTAPRSFINNPHTTQEFKTQSYLRRSQQIQKFYQQQLHHFHTQHHRQQKQIKFAMSSLAAEPLAMKTIEEASVATVNAKLATANGTNDDASQRDSGNNNNNSSSSSSSSANANSSSSSASGRPCFNTGFAEIIQFMELIGNLKHTKRTGWVLRDVNDCESISGHMYRMSMMTFLLDGSEGLNQIRCMELALVHDLAESLVGDITPFCGVSKRDKRAMEFKAMEDICNLIEPRGKRIMELFEEYETGESAESKFVKDLDRLDMVMQAFEYEKRDNCLLKHQEFFDSTEGKFNHPFVKKLVNEIYEQRQVLAKAKGATLPAHVDVPSMEDHGGAAAVSNGHTLENDTTKKSS